MQTQRLKSIYPEPKKTPKSSLAMDLPSLSMHPCIFPLPPLQLPKALLAPNTLTKKENT